MADQTHPAEILEKMAATFEENGTGRAVKALLDAAAAEIREHEKANDVVYTAVPKVAYDHAALLGNGFVMLEGDTQGNVTVKSVHPMDIVLRAVASDKILERRDSERLQGHDPRRSGERMGLEDAARIVRSEA